MDLRGAGDNPVGTWDPGDVTFGTVTLYVTRRNFRGAPAVPAFGR